jgi:SAM-dependent methyltransferase
MGNNRIRRSLRRVLPPAGRRLLRRILDETPDRIRDAVPDALDRFRDPGLRLPPAALRRRVSLTSSRREYDATGEVLAHDVVRAFDAYRRLDEEYPRWLDFGCGSGRIARHVARSPSVGRLTGIDVDTKAVAWLASTFPAGDFHAIAPEPPAPLPGSSFDVVYAVSVFSHFDENATDAWLAEISRLLRPGGLLIASTLSPKLTWTRPDLSEEDHLRLQRDGFLFAPGSGPFNENGAFSSRERLESRWGRVLEPRSFEEHGLAGYQDLTVWEKSGRERR